MRVAVNNNCSQENKSRLSPQPPLPPSDLNKVPLLSNEDGSSFELQELSVSEEPTQALGKPTAEVVVIAELLKGGATVGETTAAAAAAASTTTTTTTTSDDATEEQPALEDNTDTEYIDMSNSAFTTIAAVLVWIAVSALNFFMLVSFFQGKEVSF